MHSKLTCLTLGVLLSAALLFGQTGASSVTGRVTDATGAVVTGAAVTITEVSTNISKTTKTNTSGLYLFNEVEPGTYDITVVNAGFRKSVIRHQEVLTGPFHAARSSPHLRAYRRLRRVEGQVHALESKRSGVLPLAPRRCSSVWLPA